MPCFVNHHSAKALGSVTDRIAQRGGSTGGERGKDQSGITDDVIPCLVLLILEGFLTFPEVLLRLADRIVEAVFFLVREAVPFALVDFPHHLPFHPPLHRQAPNGMHVGIHICELFLQPHPFSFRLGKFNLLVGRLHPPLDLIVKAGLLHCFMCVWIDGPQPHQGGVETFACCIEQACELETLGDFVHGTVAVCVCVCVCMCVCIKCRKGEK